MTVDEQIAAARDLIARSDPATTGLWPRAAALLARQALERTIDEYWERRAPGVQHVSTRAQLSCLREYLGDPELAGDITYCWGALSAACHHHAYEVGLTELELREHLEAVERVAARLAPRGNHA